MKFRRMSLWLRVCCVCLGLLAPVLLAQPARSLVELRAELVNLQSAMGTLRLESLGLASQSAAVEDELADLDRQSDLFGPVKRARYDRLRQQGEELAGRQELINRREDQLQESFRTVAGSLISELNTEIAIARERYQKAALDSYSSSEAAIAFREFRELRGELKELQRQVAPAGRYLKLDVEIEPDDSPSSLRAKADLIADNRDITVRLLSQLTSWGRQLREDHLMYEENLKLLEENELLRAGDPLDLPPDGVGFGLAPSISLPPGLSDLSDRLPIPVRGVADDEGYNRLLAELDRLATELEDDVLEMNENEKRMRAEADAREVAE